MDNDMNYNPRRTIPCRRTLPFNNANVFIICMSLIWIIFLIVFVLNNYLLLQMALGHGRINQV